MTKLDNVSTMRYPKAFSKIGMTCNHEDIRLLYMDMVRYLVTPCPWAFSSFVLYAQLPGPNLECQQITREHVYRRMDKPFSCFPLLSSFFGKSGLSARRLCPFCLCSPLVHCWRFKVRPGIDCIHHR